VGIGDGNVGGESKARPTISHGFTQLFSASVMAASIWLKNFPAPSWLDARFLFPNF
jgi:hypothetical protein